MNVITYLKKHGLDSLISEFAIKVKQYDEGLIVLNYDQINSPKTHPIVMECRGLILDNDFNVVSRSFDRFFNLGEAPETQMHIDMKKATCFDKIDGSLIRLYHWNGGWHIATRGTAFAESEVNGFNITFRELVIKALGDNFHNLNILLNPEITYICELTCMENRIVTRYEGYKLHYLAARHNKTFEFVDEASVAGVLGMQFPREYRFNSVESCVQTASNLKNLEEGYVLYQDGVPVCKIKSPAYCAVHLLRGEGLNPKRIAELVLTGEQEEYLAYYPEDRVHIAPYVDRLDTILKKISELWEKNKDVETQKEFALAVKDYPCSAVLFALRAAGGKKSVREVWESQRTSYKIDAILAM